MEFVKAPYFEDQVVGRWRQAVSLGTQGSDNACACAWGTRETKGEGRGQRGSCTMRRQSVGSALVKYAKAKRERSPSRWQMETSGVPRDPGQ